MNRPKAFPGIPTAGGPTQIHTLTCDLILVDDDPFQRRLISHQLAQLGFEPSGLFSSAGEALAFLETRSTRECLILLDLKMPDMDGVELIRHLAHREVPTIDIVLVSGADQRVLDAVIRLARLHGLRVLGAYSKPVTLDQLADVLAKWEPQSNGATRSPRRQYNGSEIRRAIDERQLANFYQPKIDVASGVVVGAEALVRWHHPEDGLVMPDQFIDSAEESTLIDELTRYVFDAALQDARSWHHEGLPLSVAINVSMNNLTSLDFADYIIDEMRRTDTAAMDVTLEITESRLMRWPREALEVLARLSLQDVVLSIDDFGTGHSSLAQLRDIPFTELKIDKGFVHGAYGSPSLNGIFEGCLQIARTLGMRVVAEGVEDLDDWIFLRDRGCDYAQGYLIAKPIPAELFVDWVRSWEPRDQVALAM